ncbi:glycosyltransferase family 4 protein [Myxococcus faecalis]|uniref:glycosyltransferase family 4 protein n=1 Tax=Myxococcus faecalis TaxID=3115646 RepID=UPI003CEED506
MRVLLAIHHPLDPNQGASGVTLALGDALEARGCEVSYFDYRQAFPGVSDHTAVHNLRFPWVLAHWLSRHAHRFDVLDVTTGDCWPWARMGRPDAKSRHALVTRSHGLEHARSECFREAARKGSLQLSWKYPLYHGGFRLWEVRQSLLLSDHSVLINAEDAAYSRERLGVPGTRLSVIPLGLSPEFLASPPPTADSAGPLRVAFVGTWLPLKGRNELVAVASALAARDVDFTLSLLGTGGREAEVLGAFAPEVRDRIHVTPRYAHERLPELLSREEVLLFPSHNEGFGMALVESMASGLVPVTTPVGVALDVVKEGVSGHLFPVGDVATPVEVLVGLAADRGRLLAMRKAAQQGVQGMSWTEVAARTLALYEEVLRRKS